MLSINASIKEPQTTGQGTDALHMVQLQFAERDMTRSAQIQGMPDRVDDLGYVLHGHLSELFGELAPRPFHAAVRHGRVSVFGYGQVDDAALERHMQLSAEPAAYRSVRELVSKPMPTEWTPGRRLSFEVRACPTVRRGSIEQDAFLSAAARRQDGEPEPARQDVYAGWLQRSLGDAARLDTCHLDRFRLTRLFRRGQAGADAGRRRHRLPCFPDALLTGELTVSDGRAFSHLLARGIGRHRAFGFGMLRVRAAPTRS